MKEITKTRVIEYDKDGKVIKETETTVEKDYPGQENPVPVQPYIYPWYPVPPITWYGNTVNPNTSYNVEITCKQQP
jgi:hypothetical protein